MLSELNTKLSELQKDKIILNQKSCLKKIFISTFLNLQSKK